MAIELQVATREATGKGVARKLRAAGQIPGVIYGPSMETPLIVQLDPLHIVELFQNPKGRNVVFNIAVEGSDSVPNVMVKDYSLDPVRRNLLHVDLQQVELDKPIRVKVPIRASGRSEAQSLGGIMNVLRPNIDLYARPQDIPAEIVIDVSELKLGETVLASMVELPEAVQPGFRADYGLLRVTMPRKRAALLKDGEEVEGAAVAE